VPLTTVDLLAAVLRLCPGGVVAAEERRMDADDDGWTVAVTRAETDEEVHSDYWEVHPASDEAVCVLSGQARLYLRSRQTPEKPSMVVLAAGSGFVVPRNRWHRFALDAPSDLMSIARRAGSRLERLT
jgi:mannose-6-phosphate isomerase-like protein (cupin superfamily)